MKKVIVTTLAVAALAAGMSACDVPEDGTTQASDTVKNDERVLKPGEKAEKASDTGHAKAEKKEKPKPSFTTSQEQAIASALSYVDSGAFSKRGLTEQLSSEYGEGFPKKDAVFAVDHIDVNWDAEAVEAAKSYLDSGSFSKQGLIDQLSSEYGEGFSHEVAVKAVNKVYR